MQINEFILELSKRWEMPEVTADDIKRILSNVNSVTLEKLLDAIVENYTYNTPPKLGAIKKIARESDLELANTESVNPAWYLCRVCETAYSIHSRGCPVCKKMTPVTVGIGESYPQNYIQVRRDCYQCKNFLDEPPGPMCTDYATGGRNELCERCPCFRCCHEEHMYTSKPLLFREEMWRGKINSERYGV